jgi:hypothetical protein
MNNCPHGEPSPMCCIECLETSGFGEPVRPEERTGRQMSASRESACPRCRAEIDINELLDLTTLGQWVCCGAALPLAVTA